MSIKALSDYTVYSRYSRYLPEQKRRETWQETVERVFKMHERKFEKQLQNTDLRELVDFAKEQVNKKRVLGSQRALQFGGDPILKHNEKMYNCFDEETSFITSEGVKSFTDFGDGDNITVLTHEGNWKSAVVRSYGKQQLYKLKFKHGKKLHEVKCTRNHRWLLKNGIETTNISVGDKLLTSKTIFNFQYDNASIEERLYWCYGYIYGDGTTITKPDGTIYSLARLCGRDIRFVKRFLELGFKSSSSLSLQGDVIVYTGKYDKTPPDPSIDSPNLIQAFVRGYLDADGTKNSNATLEQLESCCNPFYSISAEDKQHQTFIETCFPIAGVFIKSVYDKSNQQTNYGTIKSAKLYNIQTTLDRENKYGKGFTLVSIEPLQEDVVWCLEVEDDQSFVLPNGMVTGNCATTYIDRFEAFQQIMFLLLCGCGVGFSVQKHHIDKLPKLCQVKDKTPTTIVIDDTIEGWADSIGQVIGQYMHGTQWCGKKIEFDYSQIRPEGSLIAGAFKAPGPKGLKIAHNKIVALCQARLEDGTKRFKPIDVYDIIMHASDAVLSGGVRRSATICVFSHDDEEMINAKTGDWFVNNPQRGRSNNSAMLIRNEVTKEEFDRLMKSVKEYGEPGFVWAEDKDVLFNPCVTSDTWITTKEGPKQIQDVLGRGKQHLLLDGKWHETTDCGFIQTGKKQVFQLTLDNGMSIKSTDNHQFLTKDGWKELKDITTDDCVLLPKNFNVLLDNTSFEEGWLIGNLIGDGTFSTNEECKWSYWDDEQILSETCNKYLKHCNLRSENIQDKESSTRIKSIYSTKFASHITKYNISRDQKTVTSDLEKAGYNICRGVVTGLFDSDGCIHGSNKVSITAAITQTNKETLKFVQRVLIRHGVPSRIIEEQPEGYRLLPDGQGGETEYYCNKTYRLYIIGRYNVTNFINIFTPQNQNKLQKYYQIESTYTKTPYQTKTNFMSKVVSVEDKGIEAVYDCCVPSVSSFEANGMVIHNCVEIGFYPQTDKGKSGVQFCNLTEINGRKCKDVADFLMACKASAIIGTLQAAYTDFPYLGEISEEIVKREALLGCSITGLMDQPDVLFDEKVLCQGAKLIKQVNKQVAELIGVNPAARTTCIKPAGSTSCVLGTASGIHPHHAKRYIRRVQANKLEFPVRHFASINPLAVEESVWSNNKTDQVISFLCEVPPGAITKNQMSAIELLEKVKFCQQNWVEYGTNVELCVKPFLRHNVSNTITVKPEEWDEVAKYIYRNRNWFAGISLLPASGDKDYAQAPFTTIFTPAEIAKEYGDASIFASGLIVGGLKAFNNNLWRACDIVLYNNQKIDEEQELWIDRAKRFADKYFDGDLRKMTYCLKDVHNWKTWCDLRREYKEIDWSVLQEIDPNIIDVTETTAVACNGKQCEIFI